MSNKLLTLIAIIFVVALFRWLPHPPNVSPVAAMALFGGAYFADKRMAFIVPFLALMLGDLLIGFHDTMLFVYGGFALTVCIGFWLKSRISASSVLLSAITASLVFFIITNFGVWATSGMYAYNIQGLTQAYVAAIPFFQNSLIGNLLFSAAMFGGYSLLQQRLPALHSH